jgi:hypothetical protein
VSPAEVCKGSIAVRKKSQPKNPKKGSKYRHEVGERSESRERKNR